MRRPVSVHRKGARPYGELVLSAVESTGLAPLVERVGKILIKPNLVTAKTSSEGVTVDLNILCALVEAIRAANPKAEVVVGESALIDTEAVFRKLGVYALEESGCRVEDLEKGEWVEVRPPFSLLFSRFLIPKTAYESDLIINVAKMKTHELTGVTLGLKNFFGLLSGGARRYAHLKDINGGIVDIYSYFEKERKVVTIIDGLTALAGKSGPIMGRPLDMDCLVCGADTVAVDAAAALVMGAPPSRIEHIRLAAKVMGVDISSMRRPAEVPEADFDLPLLPEERPFRVNKWVHDRFYKYPVQKDPALCTECRRCESICPVNIVSIEGGRFHYDPDGCAHCLCCVEACNHGAIKARMKNERLFQALRYGWKAAKALKDKKTARH